MSREYVQELETERSMKDRFMAHHAESPFVSARVDGFHGLHYFPIDDGYRVSARLVRTDPPTEAFLRTNRDGQAVMRCLGALAFQLQGRALSLRVYHAGEGIGTSVFVPFRDATSGRETYGSGRYLTLELNESDEYELDFNRAFNPYCAYTDAYECPFPPVENDLPVPVRAGERAWERDGAPSVPPPARPKPRVRKKVSGARPSARRAPVRRSRSPARRPAARRARTAR